MQLQITHLYKRSHNLAEEWFSSHFTWFTPAIWGCLHERTKKGLNFCCMVNKQQPIKLHVPQTTTNQNAASAVKATRTHCQGPIWALHPLVWPHQICYHCLFANPVPCTSSERVGFLHLKHFFPHCLWRNAMVAMECLCIEISRLLRQHPPHREWLHLTHPVKVLC